VVIMLVTAIIPAFLMQKGWHEYCEEVLYLQKSKNQNLEQERVKW
jgi:hypothetical protein